MLKKLLEIFKLYPLAVFFKKHLFYPEAVIQEKKALGFYSQFIKKGDLCFDIGANIGQKTKTFLKLGARVIAVEPQGFSCQQIQKLYGSNKNLTVINKGLADKSGHLELLVCEDCPVISTMSEKWKKKSRFSKDYKWTKTEKVAVTTLDNLIAEYGLPKFCKIDVEGFEESVVKGLTKPIPYISFEFTEEFFDDTKKCINYLLSLGSIEFNCVIGESMELLFSKWVSAAKLYAKLDTIRDKHLWGDIYLRNKNSLTAKKDS